MNTLRQSIEEYLAMRRSLGFKMQDAGRSLQEFATFMERRRTSHITQTLALTWAQKPPTAQPAYWASRLCHVRQFARYRSASDPSTQIPAPGLLPFKTKRARPYLYTDGEIEQLLHTTLHMPLSVHCSDRKACALLRWVYYCLFGLLSVSGLRLGEARNLKLDDVDLKARVLTVRAGKLGKDRWVPLHPSTCKVLAQYLDKRERHWAGRSVSSYFFVSSWGNRLNDAQIRLAFYVASRSCGLRGAHESHGPRLHDLRHRFATTTLVNWYRSNQDPERRLPLLSAFLGHVHVADTHWYLSGSPELMREAMRRLEHRWGKPS
jgi:integrase/recombinase XerD